MTSMAQSTQPQPQLPPTNSQLNSDSVWSVVGQYGVGLAALLAILKAYADYQLKAAMEDRALKVKENAQSLEIEGRVMGSLLSQQESSVASTGQLLNTFIAKTLNQAESNAEQTASLVETINTLTQAIKYLGDTQHEQVNMLHELKDLSASNASEMSVLLTSKDEIMESLNVLIHLTNQTLSLVRKVMGALSTTTIHTD